MSVRSPYGQDSLSQRNSKQMDRSFERERERHDNQVDRLIKRFSIFFSIFYHRREISFTKGKARGTSKNLGREARENDNKKN